LTTTNVVLPRRVFNTYDIEYITIFFDYNQIQRIPSPAISSQLAPKLRHMRIRCYNSCSNLKIDSKAFDNLHMLETLNITGCGVTDDIIKSGLAFRLVRLYIVILAGLLQNLAKHF
jgi:hypothetical protein